jgi:hypothetical protein
LRAPLLLVEADCVDAAGVAMDGAAEEDGARADADETGAGGGVDRDVGGGGAAAGTALLAEWSGWLPFLPLPGTPAMSGWGGVEWEERLEKLARNNTRPSAPGSRLDTHTTCATGTDSPG